MDKRKPPTEQQLCDVYHVTRGQLQSLRTRGADIYDARSVLAFIKKAVRKPPEWKEVFNVDEDSHEFWKKEKTKEEVERLRLANAKASGEMFDKEDGEKVQDAWAAALSIKLSERAATYPQLMAGKDEAWIADFVEGEDRRLREELSDLESGLWQQVFEKYASVEDTSAGQPAGGKAGPAAKADGQRVVRAERESGAGADAPA